MNNSENLVITIDRDSRGFTELSSALNIAGFQMLHTTDLDYARELISTDACKAVVIDRHLPEVSGLQFTKILRSFPETKNRAIVMVSFSGTEFDIVEALESGVDDYMTKPIRAKELVRRIEAIVRCRKPKQEPPRIKPFGKGVLIDTECSTAFVDGKALQLTSTEFRLLSCLVHAPNRVMTRSFLIDHVWKESSTDNGRKVDVHIRRLRSVLKPLGIEEVIQTSQGEGYFFKPTQN